MVFRKNPLQPDELRQMALARWRSRGLDPKALDLPSAQRLFEELEIHQIELELQNQHLSQARAQLEAALNQSTELYDFSPVGNLLLDGEGGIIKVNLSGAQMLGKERARLLGSKLGLYLPLADRLVFNALLGRAKAGETVAGEMTLLNDWVAPHVQINVAPLSDTAGWQIVLVDISSRKAAEEALRLAANFQQAVFDSLSAQVAVLDRLGVLTQTNHAWRTYTQPFAGIDAQAGVGEPYLDVLRRLTQNEAGVVQRAQDGMALVLAGKVASFQLQQPFFVPADQHWFSMKITPVRDAQERLLVSHEDVTGLKAAELASTILANVDALTGALSRQNFLNLAEQELQRSTRYALPLMVLMMDLDHFKQINDRFGHAAGDAVLQRFVQTVSDVLRESDLLGRVGGEEFAVLLPNTPVEGGRALAQRIIDSVQSSPVWVCHQWVPYTVSIGAGCLGTENGFSSLLGVADMALYRAKNAGRNRLEIGP